MVNLFPLVRLKGFFICSTITSRSVPLRYALEALRGLGVPPTADLFHTCLKDLRVDNEGSFKSSGRPRQDVDLSRPTPPWVKKGVAHRVVVDLWESGLMGVGRVRSVRTDTYADIDLDPLSPCRRVPQSSWVEREYLVRSVRCILWVPQVSCSPQTVVECIETCTVPERKVWKMW